MNKNTTYLFVLAAAMLLTGCASPLKQAAMRGDTTQVQQLLDKGVDVNAKDSNGETALMEAAGNGHTEVVKQLLAKGADVNAKSSYGYTALLYAADKGHTECVGLLLDGGANINVQSSAPVIRDSF
jgi:ankyrin repeat protein